MAACRECGDEVEGRRWKCDPCKRASVRARDRRKYSGKGKSRKSRSDLGRRGTVLERFEIKVKKDPDSGCWIWQGSLNRRGGGYPQLSVDGRTVRAHRWSYEHFKGPIPDRMTIEHDCGVTACVNPEHLSVLSRSENSRRGRQQQDDARAAQPPTQTVLRGREVLARRAAGKTFSEIAEELGFANASGAWKAYQRAAAESGQALMTDDERRSLELHRLDVILAGLWETASKGDLAAVDRYERLTKVRIKIDASLRVAPAPVAADDQGEGSADVVPEDRVARLRKERNERAAARRASVSD